MDTWTARDILDSIDEGKLLLAQQKAETEAVAQRRIDEATASNAPATVPEIDWLIKAKSAVGPAAADGNEAAIVYALIGILEHLRLITTPLYGGKEHAIQTFDNSRGQLP